MLVVRGVMLVVRGGYILHTRPDLGATYYKFRLLSVTACSWQIAYSHRNQTTISMATDPSVSERLNVSSFVGITMNIDRRVHTESHDLADMSVGQVGVFMSSLSMCVGCWAGDG